ncbi:hypothetical protein CI15_31810 [Paraburkholderia monticola]|uniref:DUF4148 domain-containing protein n=1 Tax=Paraburkholderia monticola TaxID=1399968 RepID=A0A149PAV6_9BURK|nr:DUF4148 domain-containing protein [Paraburkholderia monticola]KXU82165.1 hypothetical protein CI15_31810 [Paraburkholderia monticola]
MIVLTCLAFGAVTIGAYVSQLDNDWSSGRDVSLVTDGERGVTGDGAATPPSEGRPGATASAQGLRRHALRDDVAASRALTNQSIGAQAGDALAIAALQLARETNPPQQTNAAPQPALKSSRIQTSSTAKNERAPQSRVAHGEHTKGASGNSKKPHSTQSVATTSGSHHARGGSHRSGSSAERSAKRAAGVAPGEWSLYAGQGSDSLPPIPRGGLTSQADTPAIAGNAPKTRAQVQAELVRARENGTMPAFGNPQPTGPRP